MAEDNAGLRRARERAGLSRVEVAEMVAAHVTERTGHEPGIDAHYVAKLERGAIRWPNADYRDALRHVLAAPTDGTLGFHAPADPAAMLCSDPDAAERVAHVLQHPRRVDAGTVTALADVLAATRRLEDTTGSAAVLPGVRGQLALAEGFRRSARDGVRDDLVRLLGEMHQYTGWLISEGGDYAGARRHLDAALAAGLEVDDPDGVSLALSFTGHVAGRERDAGSVVALSRAAARDERVFVAQHAYNAFQEARGHGMSGEADAAGRALARADTLAEQAAERMPDAPPGQYWYSPGFFAVQHGLAWHTLRDAEHAHAAIEKLTAGLDAMPAEESSSEWAAIFRVRLALSHADAGDLDHAVDAALAVADLADALGSPALRTALVDLHDDLARRHPRARTLGPLRARMG